MSDGHSEFTSTGRSVDPSTTPTSNSFAQTAQNVASSVSNVDTHPVRRLFQSKSHLGAASALSSVHNSETVKSIANGPVATNIKVEAGKTSSEFANLAASRTTPDQPAATGQPLTHYHSLFYNLLSWKNPRATAAAYATSVITILLARYLNIISYVLKLTYFSLGITATLEVAGRTLFSSGLATSIRPRRYYTISKESLEAWLQDVEQLVNFFVIEAQRILFAENVGVTIAAFAAAFVSYWSFKIVPFWGLVLVGTNIVFLTPLVYVKNSELIDSVLQQTNDVVASQASQLRDITSQHAAGATESLKGLTNQYTAKAQELVGSRQFFGTTASPAPTNSCYSPEQDLPTAPKSDPVAVGSVAPGSTTGGESFGTDPVATNRSSRDTADGGEKDYPAPETMKH